jgi:hypothetical protein
LELAAEEPHRARVVIVEAQTAGREAEARYADLVDRVSGFLREGRSAGPDGGDLPESFEGTTIAGLAWLLQQRLAAGDPVDPTELLPEMERIAIEPYAGGAAP